MTYAELVNLINNNLTRVGTNRVSAAEVKEVAQAILDFAAAIDNADAIPTWTNLLTFQTDGSGAGKYCKHPDVNGKLRIFETKIVNNTGNEPPTDPNVTENANWVEISASAGSGIKEWAPGIYGAGLVIVYHNHSVDGSGLYKLMDPVRPFNSVNIETEISALKWEKIGGSGKGIAKIYADLAALLADQAQQKTDFFYFVTDASADATVDAGWAMYQKLAASTGAIGDYRKLSEQESLDVLHATEAEVFSGTITNKTVTPFTLSKAIQNGKFIYGVAAGTNAYTVGFTPALAALEVGQTFRIKFTNGNTGPVTINPDGLGAIALKKNSTTDLGSGDIQPGQIIDVAYDGVNFQILAFYGLNITAAELAAIPNGETNLFTVTKSIDGSMVSYGAGVSQIDKFGPSGLDALLADSAAWGNLSGKNSDWIRLTGDNRSGDLGQSGQEHVIASNFYLCLSHVTGVTAVDGQADWVRNKSIDVETSSSVITDITNETGWANNRKTSVVKTKVGAWYTSLSAGYTYFCYGDNGVNPTAWYWARVGEPQAIDGRISDATLIAEIEAHNFATTPILTPVASVKGEDMQEHFWENPSGTPHVTKCYNISGTIKWVKLL